MKENLFEKEVTILGVSKYDFTSENGEVIRGCKVTCLGSSTNDNSLGSQVYILNVDYSIYNNFEFAKFPCKCKIKFSVPDFTKRVKIDTISLI